MKGRIVDEGSEAATTGSGVAIEAPAHVRPVLITKELPRRNPPAASLKELTEDHKQCIELMVHGLDEAGEIEGEYVEAHKPLTLRQASRALGLRLRRMREMSATPLFQQALNAEVAALRNAERPRNLQVAIAIRDDEGDGSAATKTVRLKAIQSIEGRDGGASVNVQINNTQNNVTPGYVIRLPAEAAKQPPMIDATPVKDT
jgi:hypothetical protein